MTVTSTSHNMEHKQNVKHTHTHTHTTHTQHTHTHTHTHSNKSMECTARTRNAETAGSSRSRRTWPQHHQCGALQESSGGQTWFPPVCVCMYVYVCKCVCVCMYACACVCMWACACWHVCVLYLSPSDDTHTNTNRPGDGQDRSAERCLIKLWHHLARLKNAEVATILCAGTGAVSSCGGGK